MHQPVAGALWPLWRSREPHRDRWRPLHHALGDRRLPEWIEFYVAAGQLEAKAALGREPFVDRRPVFLVVGTGVDVAAALDANPNIQQQGPRPPLAGPNSKVRTAEAAHTDEYRCSFACRLSRVDPNNRPAAENDANGTFRTWLDVRVESVMRLPLQSGHWLAVPIRPLPRGPLCRYPAQRF